MGFIILQLLLLVGLFTGLAALTRRAWLRGLIAFLGTIATGIELLSVIIGSTLIDYKFYAHFKLSVAEAVGEFFALQVAGILVALLLVGFIIYRLSAGLSSRKNASVLALGVVVICAGLLSIPNGAINNLVEIGRLHFAKEKAFQQALEQAGLIDYTPKDELQAEAGKNIIAIFMESMELGFLQDNLSHLTPNLRRLKNEMHFYPMRQEKGSNFTIGALYTYFTGIPMYFKNHGNDVFEAVLDLQLSTVPQVLNQAGYHQEYIAGKPEFAGMDVMMDLMGVEVKSEKDFDPKYAVKPWGLHDKDLFEIVDGEIDRLYASKQPFAYYISTVSTHAIDGIFDKRVAKELPPQRSQLELMAMALDQHVGRLVDRLQSEGKLDNTVIYLLPDHLLMGAASTVTEDFDDPRGLYLITNAALTGRPEGQEIGQIEMCEILLEGAGVKHNMKFLANQIEGDPVEYLEKHRLPLLQLNESALSKGQREGEAATEEGDIFDLKDEEVRLVSNSWKGENDGKPSYLFIGKERLKTKRGINLFTYDGQDYQLEHYDIFQSTDIVDSLLNTLRQLQSDNTESWLLLHDSAGQYLQKRKQAFQELGFPVMAQLKERKAYLAYFYHGYVSEKSDRKSVADVFPKPTPGALRTAAERARDAKDPTKWIAHAGGALNGKTYVNALEALDHNYAKGFRYFELDIIKTSDGRFVAAHDWDHWRNRAKYAGDVPVSHAVFMQHKVLGQYTPLDMDGINRWFRAHPDAVLITDKVNEPDEFVPLFVDRNRLIMELFSFKAIEQARQLEIKNILISESIWFDLGYDKVKGMEERGIGGMAVSINTIMKYPEDFLKIKEAGLQVYAFHIGGHGLKDEAFMARSGLDYAYGLYADHWSLK